MRTLTNPTVKAHIRPDFPAIFNHSDRAESFAVIGQELAKHGETFDSGATIIIAYPHKHPDKDPEWRLEGTAELFGWRGEAHAPKTKWEVAHGIFETVPLCRTFNQSTQHALAGRQIYDVDTALQQKPLSFLDENDTARKFFVIIDDTFIKGTTIANLRSYIEHNGGIVLAAGGLYPQKNSFLAQRAPKKNKERPVLEGPFGDPLRNTARLPQLAVYFAKSAQKEGLKLTPQQCIEMLEEKLNLIGHSVFALTNNECRMLKRNPYDFFASSFTGVIEMLDRQARNMRVSP